MLFRSNDTATTEIYTVRNTLSLHDALPICRARETEAELGRVRSAAEVDVATAQRAAAEATAAGSAAAVEARRLRSRVAELEATVEAARRTSRDERGHDDVRLRLLLDTVLGAVQGLRHELALPPAGSAELPADRVAAGTGAAGRDRKSVV